MSLLELSPSAFECLDSLVMSGYFRMVRLDGGFWYLLKRGWFGWKLVVGRDLGASGEFNLCIRCLILCRIGCLVRGCRFGGRVSVCRN